LHISDLRETKQNHSRQGTKNDTKHHEMYLNAKPCKTIQDALIRHLSESQKLTGGTSSAMGDPFSSHSWCLNLPLVLSLATFQVGSGVTSAEETYKQALWWGAAHPSHPDIDGCFSRNRTFEHCCVRWENEIPTCWSSEGNLTYESCCIAKQHWAPRSFSCNGQGLYWRRLRQTLALFRVFTELNDSPLNKASPHECLVGGVLASMLSLIHLGHYKHSRTPENKSRDYEVAENLLLQLFRSPITLEEILVSGWPLFVSLDLFRSDKGLQQMAQERLPLQPPGPHTLKWSEVVVKSIEQGQSRRISSESVLRLGKLVLNTTS